MSRLFQTDKHCKNIISQSNAQLFITGGHGGLVTYDGDGSVMQKQGGPMDRLFLLMNDGQLLGDAGLDIEYGYVNFCTGRLDGKVKVITHNTEDTCIHYKFKENRDNCGVEVKGGISLLGIRRDTVLVSGTVDPSHMVCETGDKSGNDPSLPYAALHRVVVVNNRILEWFDIPLAKVLAAETAWCKLAPTNVEMLDASKEFGVPFKTQQHLGYLRVFLNVPPI